MGQKRQMKPGKKIERERVKTRDKMGEKAAKMTTDEL